VIIGLFAAKNNLFSALFAVINEVISAKGFSVCHGFYPVFVADILQHKAQKYNKMNGLLLIVKEWA
jgi:hypothetical protein